MQFMQRKSGHEFSGRSVNVAAKNIEEHPCFALKRAIWRWTCGIHIMGVPIVLRI